jgi:hypothetical protein
LEQLDLRIAPGEFTPLRVAEVAMVATGHGGPLGGLSEHPVSINPPPGTTPPSSVGGGGSGTIHEHGPPLGENSIVK